MFKNLKWIMVGSPARDTYRIVSDDEMQVTSKYSQIYTMR